MSEISHIPAVVRDIFSVNEMIAADRAAWQFVSTGSASDGYEREEPPKPFSDQRFRVELHLEALTCIVARMQQQSPELCESTDAAYLLLERAQVLLNEC